LNKKQIQALSKEQIQVVMLGYNIILFGLVLNEVKITKKVLRLLHKHERLFIKELKNIN